MPDFKIYHNPRCSKSRKTLDLLRENGIEPRIIEYLNVPPALQELKDLIKALNRTPSEILRTKEPQFKQAGLHPGSSDESILKAIVQYPQLLERPIVTNGKHAIIGRPPENVLKLLESE
jgi:arsenate reductase